MPESTIKPRREWSAASEEEATGPSALTYGLALSMPKIIVTGWTEVGWGKASIYSVMPEVLAPFNLVIANVTPDLDVRVMPNYTRERFCDRFKFRMIIMRLVQERIEQLVAELKLTETPVFDVNIDFVMGCGVNVDPSGKIITWPDTETGEEADF